MTKITERQLMVGMNDTLLTIGVEKFYEVWLSDEALKKRFPGAVELDKFRKHLMLMGFLWYLKKVDLISVMKDVDPDFDAGDIDWQRI